MSLFLCLVTKSRHRIISIIRTKEVQAVPILPVREVHHIPERPVKKAPAHILLHRGHQVLQGKVSV
jgi:hypothetical protein